MVKNLVTQLIDTLWYFSKMTSMDGSNPSSCDYQIIKNIMHKWDFIDWIHKFGRMFWLPKNPWRWKVRLVSNKLESNASNIGILTYEITEYIKLSVKFVIRMCKKW